MRKQGKIVFWNAEKAYGFIEPIGGGKQVFAHITAFRSKAQSPSIGDSVSFTLSKDKEGRLNAQHVLYAGQRLKSRALKLRKGIGVIMAPMVFFLYFILLAASTKINDIPVNLLYWQFVISVITFGVYAWDKLAAKTDRWRTSERTLHLLSLLGGWPGALLAHKWVRHKSSKQSFRRTFWVTVVLNVAAVVWLHSNDGREFMNQYRATAAIEWSR